jgi:ubiquinone/menaquinone biosynthesis C-methylase UbiE
MRDVNINDIKNSFDGIAEVWKNLYEAHSPNAYILSKRYALIGKMLSEVSGSFVIDVGCGSGVYKKYFINSGWQYIGVDVSMNMIMHAKTQPPGAGNIDFIVAEMSQLPFRKESSDLMLCLGSLEYTEDLDKTIGEISRVMCGRSTLLLSMQNQKSVFRFWDRYVYEFLTGVRNRIRKRSSTKMLERQYSYQTMRRILGEHGIYIKEIRYFNFNLFINPLTRYFKRPTYFVTSKLDFLSKLKIGILAADFIVLAKKNR